MTRRKYLNLLKKCGVDLRKFKEFEEQQRKDLSRLAQKVFAISSLVPYLHLPSARESIKDVVDDLSELVREMTERQRKARSKGGIKSTAKRQQAKKERERHILAEFQNVKKKSYNEAVTQTDLIRAVAENLIISETTVRNVLRAQSA